MSLDPARNHATRAMKVRQLDNAGVLDSRKI